MQILYKTDTEVNVLLIDSYWLLVIYYTHTVAVYIILYMKILQKAQANQIPALLLGEGEKNPSAKMKPHLLIAFYYDLGSQQLYWIWVPFCQ